MINYFAKLMQYFQIITMKFTKSLNCENHSKVIPSTAPLPLLYRSSTALLLLLKYSFPIRFITFNYY